MSWLIVLPLRLSCISSHCVSTWPGHLLRPSQPIHPHPHSTKLSASDDHSQPRMFLLPKNSKQNQVDNYLLANLHVRGMLWISVKFKFFLDFLQKGGSYKNKVFKRKVLTIKYSDQELRFLLQWFISLTVKVEWQQKLGYVQYEYTTLHRLTCSFITMLHIHSVPALLNISWSSVM